MENILKTHFKPAVITVGDELIFGEKENSNQRWMAKQLWQVGIPSELSVVLPDNAATIGEWINQLVSQHYYPILVSGGIGGTHDDCTRQGIATGLGVELVVHDECSLFLKRRARKKNITITPQIKRMTHLPVGCELIHNETGMPGFSLSGVYAFPGFPNMLKPMLGTVLKSLIPAELENNWLTKETVLELSEGTVGPYVEAFQQKYENVIIGIYPDSNRYGYLSLKFRWREEDQESSDRFEDLLMELKKLA